MPRVGELQQALEQVVARSTPTPSPCPRCPVLGGFDAVRRLAGAAKTLLGRRVEESRMWKRKGHRSAAEYLAAKADAGAG